MSVERSGVVTFKGGPMTLVGPELTVGAKAPGATLIGAGLAAVNPLEAGAGKTKLFVLVPSVDTGVCSIEGKKFSDASQTFGDDVAVFLVSADLPFAQGRWCQAEDVKNLTMLSDYREMALAKSWGVYLKELGLYARAVFVVDKNDTVTYAEIVPEVASEPDYAAAVAAVNAA
jgi:thioredoxin-dependent peroxiredoxin